MTARVPMVSLARARELGEAMGMPARRTQSPLAEGVRVWPPDGLASPAAEG